MYWSLQLMENYLFSLQRGHLHSFREWKVSLTLTGKDNPAYSLLVGAQSQEVCEWSICRNFMMQTFWL